jgi:hypothetical protein
MAAGSHSPRFRMTFKPNLDEESARKRSLIFCLFGEAFPVSKFSAAVRR